MYENVDDIFYAIAFKYLSRVDVPKNGSNQHELGGLKKAGIGEFLGNPRKYETFKYNSTMFYIDDTEELPTTSRDKVSWYDSRRNSPHRSPEFRLYYKDNDVTSRISESDFMLIGLTKEREILIVFTPRNSITEFQLRTIFSIGNIDTNNQLKKIDIKSQHLALPINTLLNSLGIELYNDEDDKQKLSTIIDNFGEDFPKTKDFSKFIRKISEPTNPVYNPDKSLLIWMNEEERTFRLLERHIVSKRLKVGFGENGDDVDMFISFSLSVQNRRKSRAGHAFENHIEEILKRNEVLFERGKQTEGKQKPDFLFPGAKEYHNTGFDRSRLRMLGAKTSCKERWRQVIAEAEKIDQKHLITLEPAISLDQTNQMSAMNLKLVVPEDIQKTYKTEQIESFQTFREFIDEVKETQID